MTDDPRHKNNSEKTGMSDEAGLNDFARSFDQQWNDAIQRLPGASAADPTLWARIRQGAKPRERRRSRSQRNASQNTSPTTSIPVETSRIPDASLPVPASQWHRGLLVFALVTLVGCVMFFMPGGTVEQQYGTILREAPQLVTPVLDVGCNVAPLTRDKVYAIAIDVNNAGIDNTRELFASPPPFGEYPHTETWLPKAGSVEMADGSRPVRQPTVSEFRGAVNALSRYLRCQEEGTNFQLWALESPVEVQRQILQQITSDRGWLTAGSESRTGGEITEPMIRDTIDRLGPEKRSGGTNYMTILGLPNERVEPNPEISAAYVADNPETGDVEYAWIGTQWVNAETGDVINVRGAGLGATPVPRDGTIDNLVVMILRFDTETGSWLVEWLVPTI